MQRLIVPQTLAEWNERGKGYLPGHLGMEFLAVAPDEARARMRVGQHNCAWNGYLHAGAVLGSSTWWVILAAGAGRLRAHLGPGLMRGINVVSGCTIPGFAAWQLAQLI